MRVVFDSNVWIAALIASGTSKEVVQEAAAVCDVYASPYILDEVDRFLVKKAGATEKDRNRVRKWMKSVAVMVEPPSVEGLSFQDSKDLPILWLVMAVHADLLITGDAALQALKEIRGIKIIPPALFWANLR